MSDSIHANHRARVRARFIAEGLDGFADHQVLELLLFYCMPRKDTNELAHRMLNEYGGVANLLNADIPGLQKRLGISENTAALIALIPQLSRWYAGVQRAACNQELSTARAAYEYAAGLFVGRPRECLFCICLNIKNRVLGADMLTEGTVSKTAVFPRQIVECALKYNAAAVILAHNHPSGDVSPSPSDREVTRAANRALEPLEIRLLDHIIVGACNYYSFTEDGHGKCN